jgi:hypothetical protein
LWYDLLKIADMKLGHKNAIYLKSEALKMINYDKTKHTLEAMFNNNRIYQYKSVPEKVWLKFLKIIEAGDSAGAFINKEIKPFYKCIEIETV